MNIPKLQEEAATGSVVAQGVLGLCYLLGDEVAVDYEQAFKWLSMAAKRGASRSQWGLAHMLAEGLGVEKNMAEAIPLFKSAARTGEFSAQIELGRIYSRGTDVPVDHAAAFNWYSAALAQSDSIDDCEEMEEARKYIANTKRQ
jgi:TPR repeat protein